MNLLRNLALLAALFVMAPPASAQDSANDIEVKGEDILRTCREIHKAPQAQDPAARVTGQGIVFDCRLVNANGSTLAQVLPEEVCERLVGSRAWTRGSGTQVYCDGDAPKTRAVAVPCPQPLDEAMSTEDVTRACQKLNRSGNVGAEALVVTVNGPQLGCRVSNANGFATSGITPEYVCEVKTGRRYWCNTETSVFCRGNDYVEQDNPNPGPNPVVLSKPFSKINPKPLRNKGKALKPSELEPKAVSFCSANSQEGDYLLKVVKFKPNPPGTSVTLLPELVSCGESTPSSPDKLCQELSGSPDWYLSANGFEVKNGLLFPNFVVACSGGKARKRLALAGFTQFCQARDWPLTNTGVLAGVEPYCHDGGTNGISISATEVCQEQHSKSKFTVIGPLYWCLP